MIQVIFNYFLFISLISILFYTIKGVVIGWHQKLKNTYFIFSIFITAVFIILYCPFYYLTFGFQEPISVELWYFINFLCFSYFFFILMLVDGKISSKNKDNKVLFIINNSVEMNIETDKNSDVFTAKELCLIYILSLILITCFVLLSIIIIRLPGIKVHFNNIYRGFA